MSKEVSVLLAGSDESLLEELGSLLRSNPVFTVTVRVLHPRLPDPYGGDSVPDLLVLQLGHNWERELQHVASFSGARRTALLVVGAENNPQAMRLAMQAGARDFFFAPIVRDEFQAALQKLVNERLFGGESSEGGLLTVINAKGGSGASLFASNIAHIQAVRGAQLVALVDVDLQFGSLAQYFDLQVHDGLLHSLDALESLDPVALDAYMVRHRSGLHLLGSAHDRLVQPGAIEVPQADKRLAKLFSLMRKRYNQVIIDLPRQIDRFTSVALQNADRIIVVLQQSLAHIRDAQLLLTYLREFAVQPDRIDIVINRYDKRLPVSLDNIEKALHQKCVATISNDFKVVSESVNLGIPLLDYDPNAVITKEMMALSEKLSVREFPKERRSVFGRLFGSGGKK